MTHIDVSSYCRSAVQDKSIYSFLKDFYTVVSAVKNVRYGFIRGGGDW